MKRLSIWFENLLKFIADNISISQRYSLLNSCILNFIICKHAKEKTAIVPKKFS